MVEQCVRYESKSERNKRDVHVCTLYVKVRWDRTVH